MNTIEIIKARRATKAFDPDFKMTEGDIKELLEITTYAPSAFNIQHWRFVVITDAEKRKAIRAKAWDQAQVTDAAALIILCADTKAWSKNPAKYWEGTPQPVQDFLVPAIKDYYSGYPEEERVQLDEAHRTCGFAGMTLMLAAKSMGLDTCPMDGFEYGPVGEIVNLPDDHIISYMIAVGKPHSNPEMPLFNRPPRLPLDKVVKIDGF